MIYREVFKFTKQVLKFAWKLLEEKQSNRDINSSKCTQWFKNDQLKAEFILFSLSSVMDVG